LAAPAHLTASGNHFRRLDGGRALHRWSESSRQRLRFASAEQRLALF
jgi:hypothetical protein